VSLSSSSKSNIDIINFTQLMTHCLNTNLNTNIFQNEKKRMQLACEYSGKLIKGQGLAVFFVFMVLYGMVGQEDGLNKRIRKGHIIFIYCGKTKYRTKLVRIVWCFLLSFGIKDKGVFSCKLSELNRVYSFKLHGISKLTYCA